MEFAFEFYGSMMTIDNILNVTESQSEAFYIVNIPGRNTVKFLKDFFLIGFGDANAMVFDGDNNIRFIRSGKYADVGFSGRIFYSIIKQIGYHII